MKAASYLFKGCNGPCLDQELVHSNETHDVATGNIFDWFHIAAHHQNSPEWREDEVSSWMVFQSQALLFVYYTILCVVSKNAHLWMVLVETSTSLPKT